MPISSNETGLRTGVCTSTTRPTTPYEGQVIYETDTDLSYIWGGSAWQQVSGGTAVGNSGLVYITQATLGSGALTINNCFTTKYANYRIVMSNIKTATPGAVVLNLSKNGTNNGTNYFFGGLYRLYVSGGGDTTGNGINYWLSVSADNTVGSSASLDIYNPYVNTYTHYICQSANLDAGQFVSGVHKVTEQYDGISFIPYGVSGSSGTVTVYGYRN